MLCARCVWVVCVVCVCVVFKSLTIPDVRGIVVAMFKCVREVDSVCENRVSEGIPGQARTSASNK